MNNNQIIHEAKGECWHEWEKCYRSTSCGDELELWCKRCNVLGPLSNPDYSKWEHYGPMLEWAMEQEWGRKLLEGYALNGCIEILLNPLKGSTAIAEFLKERKK